MNPNYFEPPGTTHQGELIPLDESQVRRRVFRPAISILVLAAAAMVLDLLIIGKVLLVEDYARVQKLRGVEDRPLVVLLNLGMFSIHGVVLYGASRLMVLRGRSMAVLASILCLVPFFSPLIMHGIPFGIWALILLSRSDVRDAFARMPSSA